MLLIDGSTIMHQETGEIKKIFPKSAARTFLKAKMGKAVFTMPGELDDTSEFILITLSNSQEQGPARFSIRGKIITIPCILVRRNYILDFWMSVPKNHQFILFSLLPYEL